MHRSSGSALCQLVKVPGQPHVGAWKSEAGRAQGTCCLLHHFNDVIKSLYFALPLVQPLGAPALTRYNPRLMQTAALSHHFLQEEGFGCHCSELHPAVQAGRKAEPQDVGTEGVVRRRMSLG